MVGPEGFHGLFLYYGPRNPVWPRILVIGREANSSRPVGDDPEPYELRGKGSVAFWTWSHKAVERAVDLPTFDLRRSAIQVGSSPISYADASPRSVRVSGARSEPRSAVGDDELRSHAMRLCRRTEDLAFPVVIVSGERPSWRAFYDIVRPAFEGRGVAIVRVPFFGRGSTRERLSEPLDRPEVRPRILAVVLEWARANALVPPGGEPPPSPIPVQLLSMPETMGNMVRRQA